MSEKYTKAKAIEMVQDIFGMRQEWISSFQWLDTIRELIGYKVLSIQREIDLYSVLLRDFGVDEGRGDLEGVKLSLERVIDFIDVERSTA